MGQIFAALILIFMANVRITSFYGLFGVEILPYWVSVSLSLFTILLIINAFNLIDGINCLSGGLGALISLLFGIWFFLVERVELAIIAISLTGALIAFLKYNWTPAAIFMGDTGALLVGLICSMLAIKFLDSHLNHLPDLIKDDAFYKRYRTESVPAITIAILIIPLFDTLRVFVMRILRGRSPFYPDKTHIHHLLLRVGYSHLQATGILVVANILFVLLAYYLQYNGTLIVTIVIIGLATLLTAILGFTAKRRLEAKK